MRMTWPHVNIRKTMLRKAQRFLRRQRADHSYNISQVL
jgi:hypothetical protein